MMMMKKCLAYGRVAIPLLLGVCIGVALSLIILPLLEESSCELERSQESYAARKERSSLSDGDSEVHPLLRGIDIESFQNSDFEPRIIKTPPSGSQTAGKPRRYRFAASELDMKKTLLIAYLTTPSQLMQRVMALNRTLNKPELDYPEVLFFVNGGTASNGLPLVRFNLDKPGKLSLLTIRYLFNHYSQSYKFFMIVPDSTYVKTSQLKDLLVNAQAIDNPYIGVPSSSGRHCVTEVGYMLSQPTLIKFESMITKCEAMHSTTNDLDSGILDQCLASLVSSQCTSAITSTDSVFKSMSLDDHFDNSILGSHLFKEILSFANVHAVNMIYQLHRQVAKDQIESTVKRINNIKQQISAMVDSVNGTADWPIGVTKPFFTSNRYDVLRWTLVEQNTSHLEWDYVNNEPLIGAYKLDQQNMVEAIMTHVNRARYELSEVVQVYRRIDPTRGMEYQITLQLKDKLNNVEQLKTFELVKPLTRFQTLSQPFASTTATVHLLVPVLPEHTSQRFVSLMKSFSDTFTSETAGSTVLQWVLLYSETEFNGTGYDVHSKTKKLITTMSNDYPEITIKWIAVHGDDLNQVSMVTQCAAKLKESDIIITLTVSTEMSETFVNRAKGNTIKGTQIYAPIAFWQYEPKLIHVKTTSSPKVELSRPAGHFGENWFDHMVFFVSDFTLALKTAGSEYSRIVDVFIKAGNVKILRSPDPDLRVFHSSEQSCKEFVGAAENGECEMRRVDHLGSASVIAQALFKQGVL